MIVIAAQPRQRRVHAHVKAGELIVIAAQQLQHRVRAHVQTGKHIMPAAQVRQRCVLAHIQTGKLIINAVQDRQRRVRTHVQGGQLIGTAVQGRQCRVRTHAQTGKLVFVAVQMRQRCILAHIQCGQIVFAAIQIFQRDEMLYAFQVLNTPVNDFNTCDLVHLSLGHIVAVFRIAADGLVFNDPLAERIIREVLFIQQKEGVLLASFAGGHKLPVSALPVDGEQSVVAFTADGDGPCLLHGPIIIDRSNAGFEVPVADRLQCAGEIVRAAFIAGAKDTLIDSLNPLSEGDSLQRGCMRECALPDGRNPRRDYDAVQDIAIGESILADMGQAFRQNDDLDLATQRFPGLISIIHVVIHGSAAGDGQGAGGLIEGPVQVCTAFFICLILRCIHCIYRCNGKRRRPAYELIGIVCIIRLGRCSTSVNGHFAIGHLTALQHRTVIVHKRDRNFLTGTIVTRAQ